MKVFLIDWNNMTPQYTYPLIHHLNGKKCISLFFVTNSRPQDKKHFEIYKTNNLSMFLSSNFSYSFINKITKPFLLLINYIILILKTIKLKPEIIHYNWLCIPIIDLLFIKIFKLLNCKVILTKHNFIQHDKNSLSFKENAIFKESFRIFCLSHFVKNQFDNIYQKKITVIPHRNCYEDVIKNKNTIVQSKNKPLSLLLIGNIKKYKGVDFIIEVVKYLNEINFSVLLNIIGPGEFNYINRISKKIKKLNLSDKIILKNEFLDFKSFYNAINNADIGVMPYIKASQSGTPYLFHKCNKPLIISNIGGLKEQTNEKLSKVSDIDVKKFANCIIEMDIKIKKNEFHKSDFKKFLDENLWEKTINDYYFEYKKIKN